MAPQYAAIDDYVCLEARGPAAGQFLHGQLSQGVNPLPAKRAPLAGWLDARGRVRALLRVIQDGEGYVLVTARDGAEALVKRLRMFVLRSAVTIELAADLGVGAVLGADTPWLERRGLPAGATQGSCHTVGDLRFIPVGGDFWYAIGAPGALGTLAAELPAAPVHAATRAEIALGLPLVTAAIADRLVAQMLNLDALGALAFNKGCYPGQEIVARVHNLGDVKRRTRRYAIEGTPAPDVRTAVTLATGDPVGEVVRSVPTPEGAEVLALVDHAAADRPLACNGAPLTARPLPFTVPG